jgi:hypothetical protein
MKKLSILAIMLIGGGAFAASIAIPWFADNANPGTSSPPTIDGGVTIIYLKNNVNAVMTCEITYYNEGGDTLGPFFPANTFTIQPNSALAFRPVQLDANTTTGIPGVTGSTGGLEGKQGYLVPNRPRSANSTTTIPGTTGVIDSKKNGSCSIKFTGAATDIQGALQAWAKSGTTIVCYGHLLPPGA